MTTTDLRDMREESKLTPRPALPSREEEHIDILGHLCVPHATNREKAKEREGWEPFWVNVNLGHPTVQKVVKYRRIDN